MSGGIAVSMGKRGNSPSSPHIRIRERKLNRSVTLCRSSWEELDQIATFMTDAWRRRGDADGVVSRSEVIQQFVDGAIAKFWKERGGVPSKDGWRRKVGSEARRLKLVRGSSL